MSIIEAVRRCTDLLHHFGLDWKVKVIPLLMRAGVEQSGVCRLDEKTIYLVDYKLQDDATALWLIRHEVSHAVTADEPEDHGPRFKALVHSLRSWNGDDVKCVRKYGRTEGNMPTGKSEILTQEVRTAKRLVNCLDLREEVSYGKTLKFKAGWVEMVTEQPRPLHLP